MSVSEQTYTRIGRAVTRILDRPGSRFLLAGLLNRWTRANNPQVQKILFDDGVWMHQTSRGYFAYPKPVARLDMSQNDERARWHFLWGYQPQEGDVVLDIGAGVGEEALLFSREVGERGKVICVEAHPKAYRCLQKLVAYNRLANVTLLHQAVAEPSCAMVKIKDSDEYLTNRIGDAAGIRVKATTVDAIHQTLGLGRINFLKMNIEGAERLAIQGMSGILRSTEVLCISCHDFQADQTGDEFFRTKALVMDFLQHSGLEMMERKEDNAPSYVNDQVWAFNVPLLESANRAWRGASHVRAS